MGFDEIVDHVLDRVDVELASRVRVEHCRLVDVIFLLCDSRFDREKLNIDVRHVHSGALDGDRTDVARDNAVTVDKARYFNARFLGEVRDEVIFVQHVAADLERCVCDDRFHDIRCVLV